MKFRTEILDENEKLVRTIEGFLYQPDSMIIIGAMEYHNWFVSDTIEENTIERVIYLELDEDE